MAFKVAMSWEQKFGDLVVIIYFWEVIDIYYEQAIAVAAMFCHRRPLYKTDEHRLRIF